MSKTLRIDGGTSTIAIFTEGTNIDLLNNPQNYYSSLNFHSNLPYIKESTTITATVNFAAVAHETESWNDSSKGCGGK